MLIHSILKSKLYLFYLKYIIKNKNLIVLVFFSNLLKLLLYIDNNILKVTFKLNFAFEIYTTKVCRSPVVFRIVFPLYLIEYSNG